MYTFAISIGTTCGKPYGVNNVYPEGQFMVSSIKGMSMNDVALFSENIWCAAEDDKLPWIMVSSWIILHTL